MNGDHDYWQQLETAMRARNVPTFVTLVVNSLQEKKLQFKQLQQGLVTHCINKALIICTAPQADIKDMKPAVHVLLESVPETLGKQASQESREAAATLFNQCCQQGLARIAVKVALTFKIRWQDLLSHGHCWELLHQLMQPGGSYTQAANLLQHFVELQEGTDLHQVLIGLVEDGQLAGAHTLAATLPQPYSVQLVRNCDRCGRLREAVDIVKHFNLEKEFPDMQSKYDQHCLTKLLEKERWSPALTFVGEDSGYQEQVLRAMTLAGELAYAEEMRQQLGLPKTVLNVDSPEMAAQIAQREAAYLQLDLPADAVHFVDTNEAVARISFEAVEMVGLDVEWKPELLSGSTNPASLIQIATKSQVWLVDLIRLHDSHILDESLSKLMRNSAITKLGCQLSDDMSKLHRSYPHMQAFQHAVSLLNVPGPWNLHRQLASNQGASSHRKNSQVGLSAMTQQTLGKPLNKGMQMSDWGRRPLSSRQLTYAALDAFVLLQIVEAITQGGSALSQQQLQQFLFTCSAQNPQTSSQHSMSQPTTPNKDHKALLSGGKADRKRNPVNAAEAGDKKISHSPAEPSTLPAGATAMHLSPAAAEHAWSNTPSDLQQRKGRYRQQASPAMSLARQQRYPPYGLCPPPGLSGLYGV